MDAHTHHTRTHTSTYTVSCLSEAGRVLTRVTRLADQAGIWARNPGGTEIDKELFGTVRG